MENEKTFSSVVFGNTTLVIMCCEYILERHGIIVCVVTSNNEIKEWCNQQKIECLDETNKEEIKNYQFEYLFSISYLNILSNELITTPRKLAINYHDSLLPDYAGINATSWAIINGEKKHGITWHVMEQKVDTGAILIQKEVEIRDNETVFSLNMKCFDLAYQGFKELVQNICFNSLSMTRQVVAQRSYFGKNQKPEGAGLINFNESISKIKHFVQGLQFENYDNGLITPKIMYGNKLFIVWEIENDENKSHYECGYAKVKGNGIYVTALDGTIFIKSLYELDGSRCNIQSVFPTDTVFSIKNDDKTIERLSAAVECVASKETYWVRKVGSIHGDKLVLKNDIEEDFDRDYNPDSHINARLQEKILVFLQRVLSKIYANDTVTISYRSNMTYNLSENGLCECDIPLCLPLKKKKGKDQLDSLRMEIDNILSKKTYMKDIFFRYPSLRKLIMRFPIVLNTSDTMCKDSNSTIVINCFDKKNELEIIYNSDLDNAGIGGRVVNDLKKCFDEYEKKVKVNVETIQEFKSTYDLIEEQAKRRPNNTAIIYREKRLSYCELMDSVDVAENYLCGLGLKKGAHIGILLDRSEKILVYLLAVMKLGGVYIPLDPIYPHDRLQYIISDGEIEYLICDQRKLEHQFNGSYQLVDISNEISGGKIQESKVRLNPSDAVYILYTSGTTGRPKGVVINHQGLINFLMSMKKKPGFTEEDKILALTTICFDISGLELYLPLICGGQTEILDSDIVIDGKSLIEKIEMSKATVVQATPSTWNMLLISGWKRKLDIKILCGGEYLPSKLAKELLVRCSELWNMYGPTETTIWSTIKQITDENEISLGAPIDNTELYILDENMDIVDEGNGCLYIGGQGLANGYYKKDNLTKEKFIVNPYNMNEKIYITGDVVKKNKVGEIYYVGRADSQIKFHGFRIELEEIESIIQEKLNLRKVIVVLRENENSEKNLYAFILKEQNSHKIELSRLSEFLPHYMIPSKVYTLKEFPLSNNKKVDRLSLGKEELKKLLERYSGENIENNSLPGKSEYIDDQKLEKFNECENQIRDIWEKVLGAKVYSDEIAFFDAGGDSLALNRLRAELETMYQKEISIIDLISYNTIKKMERFLTNNIEEITSSNDRNMKRREFLRRKRRS